MGWKIAIVGAGPAGLTLARLLLPSESSVTVFEGETTPEARSQGGTLDLRIRSGLAALKEAGLHETFFKYARFDGEALAFTDKKMVRLVSIGGATAKSNTGRPEIDRRQLRQILIDSLPHEMIRWGQRVRRVSDNGHTYTLHFDYGSQSGYDVVVGADGAWSKIRPLVTNVEPFYTGISGVYSSIQEAAGRHCDLYQLVNKGSLFSYSDGRGILAQQLGDGSLYVGVCAVRPLDWMKTSGVSTSNVKSLKAKLLDDYKGWHPKLLKMIEVADKDSYINWPLWMLPVGHRWDNRRGVTLIGDAAHLMSPFAGIGVNIAMEDAMKLAHAIFEAEAVNTAESIYRKVEAFESDMFDLAKAAQELAYGNMQDMLFVAGAPRTTMARYVARNARAETNAVVGFIVGFLAHIYFWIFNKLF